MSRIRLTLPSASILVALFVAPAFAQSLEGTWVLAKQTYQGGEANMADLETRLHLKFAPASGDWTVLVWAGDDRDKAVVWPAHLTGGEIKTVETRERRLIADGDGIVVSYVLPDRARGEKIQITEKYQLTDDGRALVGTVLVEISKDDKDHGSYKLHRRFERAE